MITRQRIEREQSVKGNNVRDLNRGSTETVSLLPPVCLLGVGLIPAHTTIACVVNLKENN